jgi:hypothetical protein
MYDITYLSLATQINMYILDCGSSSTIYLYNSVINTSTIGEYLLTQIVTKLRSALPHLPPIWAAASYGSNSMVYLYTSVLSTSTTGEYLQRGAARHGTITAVCVTIAAKCVRVRGFIW